MLRKHLATEGSVFVDAADAFHEAGDLLTGGVDVSRFATRAGVVRNTVREAVKKPAEPVLFKSCGWGGWGMVAARTTTVEPERA